MQRLRLPGTQHSEGDSSSEEEELLVDADRYQQLELSIGLQHRATRMRALQELLAILPHYARRASKAVQASIFADLQVATTTCDARRAQVKAAVSELLRAAERLLPQQRRAQLLTGHKKAMMQQARQGKRANQGAQSDVDSDEEAVLLTDLPLPDVITLSILSQLDPLTLARSTAVCRAWRALVSSSGLWHDWAQCLYPKQVQRGGRQLGSICTLDATAFSSLATRDPRPVLPFKQPPRMYVAGQMCWSAQNVSLRQQWTIPGRQSEQQDSLVNSQLGQHAHHGDRTAGYANSSQGFQGCHGKSMQQAGDLGRERQGQHAWNQVLLPTPQQVAQWLVHEWPCQRPTSTQHRAMHHDAVGLGAKGGYRASNDASDSDSDGCSSSDSGCNVLSSHHHQGSAARVKQPDLDRVHTVLKLWDIKV